MQISDEHICEEDRLYFMQNKTENCTLMIMDLEETLICDNDTQIKKQINGLL